MRFFKWFVNLFKPKPKQTYFSWFAEIEDDWSNFSEKQDFSSELLMECGYPIRERKNEER